MVLNASIEKEMGLNVLIFADREKKKEKKISQWNLQRALQRALLQEKKFDKTHTYMCLCHERLGLRDECGFSCRYTLIREGVRWVEN